MKVLNIDLWKTYLHYIKETKGSLPSYRYYAQNGPLIKFCQNRGKLGRNCSIIDLEKINIKMEIFVVDWKVEFYKGIFFHIAAIVFHSRFSLKLFTVMCVRNIYAAYFITCTILLSLFVILKWVAC